MILVEGCHRSGTMTTLVEDDDVVEISRYALDAVGDLVDGLHEPPGRCGNPLRHDAPLEETRGCAEKKKP